MCSHSVTEVCLRFHLRFLTASSSLWHCGSMNNGQYSLPVSVPHVLYLLIGNCVLNSGLWGKRAERRGESRVARPLDWINILTSIDNNTNTELIFSLHESRPLLPWCAKAIPSVRPSVCPADLEGSDFDKVLHAWVVNFEYFSRYCGTFVCHMDLCAFTRIIPLGIVTSEGIVTSRRSLMSLSSALLLRSLP